MVQSLVILKQLNKKKRPDGLFFYINWGRRIRTSDLRVMSPTSYQAALSPGTIQ